MKQFFLLLAATLIAVTASAQEQDHGKRVVEGSFWDNWELSAGMGAGMHTERGTGNGAFGQKLGFEGNFSIVKWVSPVVGLRAQLQGGRLSNYDLELGRERWPYLFAHGDVLINFSNLVGGYREDRAYYLIPFAGAGSIWANFTDKSQAKTGRGTLQDFALTAGLLHKFRLSPAVDFHIEMKSWLTNTSILPIELKERSTWGLSATAGFAYRFGRRGWDRVEDIAYTAEDLAVYRQAADKSAEALKAAEEENARLKRALQEERDRAARAEAAAADAAAQPRVAEKEASTLILFSIGSTTLTKQEQLRLEQVAEMIKRGPQENRYKLEGYADKQTGTKALNERLAAERAREVYDFLVKQGVNPDVLSYAGMGEENPFPRQETNRSVRIR
ncbi:MAG: OmpA family protein [Alistipes sp.]|nr:OmpA family protein [Alistipes sp.]